jgi:hypothetical protein
MWRYITGALVIIPEAGKSDTEKKHVGFYGISGSTEKSKSLSTVCRKA